MSDTFEFRIPMGNDDEGFFGRECPADQCLGYFKIELGTGLQGEDLPCHCPYCGHVGPQDTFWTQDQLEYAQSVAMRGVQKQVVGMLTDAFKPHRPRRGDLFSITFDVKPGRPLPLHQYEEQQLETVVVCNECGLRYAVYGVFGYCPDCGSHNSLQILESNLELAHKQLDLASTAPAELHDQLVSDALENAVSAFDAFGRELIRVNADLASAPERAANVSCQNVDKLASHANTLFDIPLSTPFSRDEWHQLVLAFQKRHLLAHKMGVVDSSYMSATRDETSVVGRKVSLAAADIEAYLPLLRRLGEHLVDALRRKREQVA